MPLTSTSTYIEARAAYYDNRDYETGTGLPTEFRRACELLLELTPKRSRDNDGEIEIDLKHIRDQLESVNAYITKYYATAPVVGRANVVYLRPTRG